MIYEQIIKMRNEQLRNMRKANYLVVSEPIYTQLIIEVTRRTDMTEHNLPTKEQMTNVNQKEKFMGMEIIRLDTNAAVLKVG